MEAIGKKLGEARRAAGLSVEDVAHETHIHAHTIRNIEEGDFSVFPSVAYAKSFLRKYADFLNVDVSAMMQALNSGVTIRLGENELMDEMKKTIRKDRRFRLERRPKMVRRKLGKPGGAPILLNVILVAVIAALAVFYFLGYNAATPEEAKSEISKGLQRANPFTEETELAAGTGPIDNSERVEDSSAKIADKAMDEPARRTLRPADLNSDAREGSIPGDSPAVASADRSSAAPSLRSRDIEKPDISWRVEDPVPAPLATSGGSAPNSLRARKTPGIQLDSRLRPPSIPTADLPAQRVSEEELVPELRSLGTQPGQDRAHTLKPANTGETAESEEESAPVIRAIPVARSE